jgi:hypothetical protein
MAFRDILTNVDYNEGRHRRVSAVSEIL